MKYSRLDDQSGAAGEYWRLAGERRSQAVNEFELLSLQAGRLLQEAARNKEELKELIDHHDPRICWYRAIKKFSNSYEPGPFAYLADKEGNNPRPVLVGSIYNVPENSANVCLYMELHYPIRLGFYKKLWNEYGKEITITVVGTVIVAVILAILKLS